MIVADTSAWVQFLRKPESPPGREMRRLLTQGDIAITGVVLAEVLQRARTERDMDRLKDALGALPFLEAGRATWAKAGELAFHLRREGRAIPLTDLVVAAVCLENDCPVFALDEHFQRIPGVKLHEAGAA